MMPIETLMSGMDQQTYYDQGFRDVLEDHLSFLRNSESTVRRTVVPGVALRYQFDFYSMLAELGIPHHLHWIVMRMSGLTNSNQMTLEFNTVVIPDPQVLERLRGAYMTGRRIT